jgi:hypothetical protein
MQLEITTALVNQVKGYTQISASQLLGGQGSSKVLFIAEEAVSELLISWHNRNLRNEWIESNFTDNFYFISSKNAVKNVIMREDRHKRQIWKDAGNVSLDKSLDLDVTLELPDESIEDLERLLENEALIDYQLKFIVNTLENSKYINQFDIEVFLKCYVKGQFMKQFSIENKVSQKKVSNSRAKIRNVLNYLYK